MALRLAVACVLATWTCAGLAAASTHECPRTEASQAKAIVEGALAPAAAAAGLRLSAACPFHPSKSVFARQHRHKALEPKGYWRCGFCQKQFRSEAFLDRHMDLRHHTEVDGNTTVCLGDFCDILGCPAAGHHHDDHDHEDGHGGGHSSGQASQRDAAHHHGEHAAHATAHCAALMRRCLEADPAVSRDVGGETAAKAVQRVAREFCSVDPCEHARAAGLSSHGDAHRALARNPGLVFGVVPLWAVLLTLVLLFSAIMAGAIMYCDRDQALGVAPPHLAAPRRSTPLMPVPRDARARRRAQRADHTSVEVVL